MKNVENAAPAKPKNGIKKIFSITLIKAQKGIINPKYFVLFLKNIHGVAI